MSSETKYPPLSEEVLFERLEKSLHSKGVFQNIFSSIASAIEGGRWDSDCTMYSSKQHPCICVYCDHSVRERLSRSHISVIVQAIKNQRVELFVR